MQVFFLLIYAYLFLWMFYSLYWQSINTVTCHVAAKQAIPLKSFSYILCFTNFCLFSTYVRRIPQHIKIKHLMSMNFLIQFRPCLNFIFKHSHNTLDGTKLDRHCIILALHVLTRVLVCLRCGSGWRDVSERAARPEWRAERRDRRQRPADGLGTNALNQMSALIRCSLFAMLCSFIVWEFYVFAIVLYLC